MSLNDITRYVRQTPGNTNPSVIASMVNAEMSSTLEEAKKYTDSQRLAYEEKTVITWDGNDEGKEVLPDIITNREDSRFVRVYDKYIPVSYDDIKGVTLLQDKSTTTFPNDLIDIIMQDTGEGVIVIQNKVLIVSPNMEVSEGVYFFDGYYDKNIYDAAGNYDIQLVERVVRLELETVNQIDQKFIPGVTLPVINYEDYFNIPFFDAITAGIMVGVEGLYSIKNAVKLELFDLLNKNPVVIIEIPATIEDASGIMYVTACATFNNGMAAQVYFNGFLYPGGDRTIEYEFCALADGRIVTRYSQRTVTVPT